MRNLKIGTTMMKNDQDKEFPLLIGQTGPLNGQRWVVDRTLTIGRDARCEVVIPDRQVSRYHARLVLVEENVILEDLGSKNGTFCNGRRIEDQVRLEDGDLIQIALVQHFVYLASDATLPLLEPIPWQKEAEPTRRRLYLDKQSHRVWVMGREVLPPLSVPQFRLLEILYDHQGEAVSRQEIIRAVWGEEQSLGVSDQALDALVRRLRDRLAASDAEYPYLVTVRGYGFRLDNPVYP
ncbi:MAG: FHA domain-containing protein [Thermanaerothrix sp.]|uniref:FHA domain-containing protein n=1 Tax=Thermanaerothrix sp. TaxID=2972675 RepID=UPI003C79D893